MSDVDLNSNSQYKDSIFCRFFSDKVKLLSLCNALLDTNYQDPDELIINQFEGIFLSKLRNDISCKIRNQYIVLIEHQSTINENMPLRCLMYAEKLLENEIVPKRKIYAQKLIKLPTPKFFVLYNGNKEEPLQRTLKLSDAFGGDDSSLELKVQSYNINKEFNSPLLDKSMYLNDYSTFVGKVKESVKSGLDLAHALINSVRYCIANDIMKEFLEENGKEVFELFALKWNMEDALQVRYDEGLSQGISQGLSQGISQGISQGLSQGIEKIATNMLRKGKSFEEIQDVTELSIEQIEKIAKSINKNIQ